MEMWTLAKICNDARLKTQQLTALWLTSIALILCSYGCGHKIPPMNGPREPLNCNGIFVERLSNGETYMTFHLENVDGPTLAKRIGEIAGVRVLSDPFSDAISICVEHVTWRAALERVAQELLSGIVEESPEILRLIQPSCCSPFAFDRADIEVVLRLLGRSCGRDVELAPGAKGTVTGTYKATTRESIFKILESIAEEHGLSVHCPPPCTTGPILVAVR